jgi:glycerol-3-phosphate dehydrogenase
MIAIFSGLVTGLGKEYGTVTHLISLAATESARLAQTLGGQAQTFTLTSQCWGNDMLMSATGGTRNRQFGQLIGQLGSYQAALDQMQAQGKTVEGATTLQILPLLLDQIPNKQYHWPLLTFLTRLSQDQVSPHELLTLLRTL